MPADRYHLALDGTTWKAIQVHYPQMIPHIVARGTIFARFRPEQKSQIVVSLKQYDYIVAMCGDGANDCGALKAAHIGVSLSKVCPSARLLPHFWNLNQISLTENHSI